MHFGAKHRYICVYTTKLLIADQIKYIEKCSQKRPQAVLSRHRTGVVSVLRFRYLVKLSLIGQHVYTYMHVLSAHTH